MVWLYDLPVWLLFLLMVVAFTGLSLAGLYATRGMIVRILGQPPGHNSGVDAYINAAVLMYGLVAGLVAVAVFEQYTAVREKVSEEASALASLYRDAHSYPSPAGPKLAAEIRSYTEHVINVSWPLQRRDMVPSGGVAYIDRIQDTLYAFEPKTEGQKILATSTVEEFNRYEALRRARLASVGAGLPTPLWFVILFGGALTIFVTYFLALERFATHVALTILAAMIVSLLVFMIVIVDHPFRGQISIGPEDFQLVYEHLMLKP